MAVEKETEYYIDAKIANAKLQVAEDRSKLFVQIILLLFTIFGIGIPIWSKFDIEKRYEKVEGDVKTKLAELENKYNQQPKIELSFKNEVISNEHELSIKCDSSYFLQLNNRGLGRAEYVKSKLYFSDQQYYTYGPMQDYWGPEKTSDEPDYSTMFNKNEEYLNPGDRVYIPIQCPCEVTNPQTYKSYLKITSDKMTMKQIKLQCLDIKKRAENQN